MSRWTLGLAVVVVICLAAGCGGGSGIDRPHEAQLPGLAGDGTGTVKVSVSFPDSADQQAVLLAKYPDAQPEGVSRVIVGSTRKVLVRVAKGDFFAEKFCTPDSPTVSFEVPAGDGYLVVANQLNAENQPIPKPAAKEGVVVRAGQVTEVKLSFIDGWEPDNEPDSATALPDRARQREHSFERHTDGSGVDCDWFKFEARAGHTYHLATLELGGGADTVLTLFDAEGHQLAENDDAEAGVLRSLIVYTPERDQMLFLRCCHKDESNSRGYYDIIRETTAPSVGAIHVTVD